MWLTPASSRGNRGLGDEGVDRWGVRGGSVFSFRVLSVVFVNQCIDVCNGEWERFQRGKLFINLHGIHIWSSTSSGQ